MSEEEKRPHGWRRYTDEDRSEYRQMGYTEEQIDEMEKSNVYSPNPAAIRAEYLAIAMVEVLTERLGNGFATDVLSKIERIATKLGNGDSEDRVEAPLVAQVSQYHLWDRLEARPTPEQT